MAEGLLVLGIPQAPPPACPDLCRPPWCWGCVVDTRAETRAASSFLVAQPVPSVTSCTSISLVHNDSTHRLGQQVLVWVKNIVFTLECRVGLQTHVHVSTWALSACGPMSGHTGGVVCASAGKGVEGGLCSSDVQGEVMLPQSLVCPRLSHPGRTGELVSLSVRICSAFRKCQVQ